VEKRYDVDKLFTNIIFEENTIMISDMLSKELLTHTESKKIKMMFLILESKELLEKIITTKHQELEAIALSKERKTPFPDALHAVLARDNLAVLITRDKHFLNLKDICEIRLL